jgi:hypothetical protein
MTRFVLGLLQRCPGTALLLTSRAAFSAPHPAEASEFATVSTSVWSAAK